MKRSAWVAVAGTAVTVGMLAARRLWGRSSNVAATPESLPAHPEQTPVQEPPTAPAGADSAPPQPGRPSP